MKKTVIDLGGPVHVADFGGSGPLIVLVHGLGGSYTNWMSVGDALAARGRVIAPDLIGFGRTPLAGRKPSIRQNVALLDRVQTAFGVSPQEPATFVGNSMGGLVSLLYAAQQPKRVARLVLVAAALPRPRGVPVDGLIAALFTLYAIPGVGELFLWSRARRAGPERMLRDTLRLCGVDPSSLPRDAWDEALSLARERASFAWSNQAFLGAARSMLRVHARAAKVREAILGVRARTLLTHGSRDRLVPVETSRATAKLRPDWTLEVMDGVGHVPQLEVPDRWLALVEPWLAGG